MDTLPIILAISIVLITIILLTVFLRKRVRRDGVLLMGLSESGKTLIFSRLVYEKFVDTYTSLKENVKCYDTGREVLQLIDIPGQERVRGRVFDSFKSSARAIVYVVDSSKVQQDIRDVAEYLHDILCDPVINANRPRVLILCNKQDEPFAKNQSSICSLLEKELNIVRTTKASQRRLAVDNNADEISLGDPDVPFKFDHSRQSVSFAECFAVVAGEEKPPTLNPLVEWIKQVQ